MSGICAEQLNNTYGYYHSHIVDIVAKIKAASDQKEVDMLSDELADLLTSQADTISEQNRQLAEKDDTITDLEGSNAEKDQKIEILQASVDDNTSLDAYRCSVISELRIELRASYKVRAESAAAKLTSPHRDYEKIIAKYLEYKDRNAELVTRNKFLENTRREAVNNNVLTKENEHLKKENERLKAKDEERKQKLAAANQKIFSLRTELNREQKQNDKLERQHLEDQAVNDVLTYELTNALNENVDLKNEVQYLSSLLNSDSKTTNMPAFYDSIKKKAENKKEKREITGKSSDEFPVTREYTGNNVGGKPGHERVVLEELQDSQCDSINIEYHSAENTICPACGAGTMERTGRQRVSVTVDIQCRITKKKVTYYEVACTKCGYSFFTDMPEAYVNDVVQYGPNLQALALAMMNVDNTPIAKTARTISGLTDMKINPSPAYLCKLQSKAAEELETFVNQLKDYIKTSSQVYWDDTTIAIDNAGNNGYGVVRFYGTGKAALYIAHEEKNLQSLIDDDILTSVNPGTVSIHDHNPVNYNSAFSNLVHAECNVHLERRLAKGCEDSKHDEFNDIKNLIAKAMKERKRLISETGATAFDDAYVEEFYSKVLELVGAAEIKNEVDTKEHRNHPKLLQREKQLLNDIRAYFDSYFRWMKDFTIPPDNNLSERALRALKIRLKVSGHFKSLKRAVYYCNISSYIATCRLNGYNEMYALTRLAIHKPLTLGEILNHKT
ncbi:MAG: transposase [Prevotella sp.]|nr:transposase [Prevotella sp.]